MKHAFLILAHNNWWQLEELIKLIDSENHDIYIHVDKKAKNFDAQKFIDISTVSNVKLYQQYKVYWGGYSMVEAELFLLDKAHLNNYDYYHIISGEDLPLKNNKQFDSFFETHNGLEFIDFDNEKLETDPEISRRTKLFHFLQNYRRRTSSHLVNSVFVFFERVLLLIQLVLGIDRTKKLLWTIKYGSNWVSMTDRLVATILSKRDEIWKIFHLTNCSDELYIQTVAYNNGFMNSIYLAPKGAPSNLRLIDWKRGKGGSPYTFHESDYEMLIRSDALFARKFSEKVDKNIIVKIVEYVQNS